MKKKTAQTILAASVFLIFPGGARAANPKIAADLQGKNPKSTVDVIVQFEASANDVQTQRIIAKGGRLKSDLGLAKGGRVHTAAFHIPAGALEDLAGDPGIVYISPDRNVQGMLDYTVPAVNANIAWQYGWTGAGIAVAVIDSGISDVPDLLGLHALHVVYGQDFVSNGSALDQYGHGTHVAGIVGGNGILSNGRYTGLAPKADLVNLRVLDQNGTGTDSQVIAAIQRAIQLKSQYNIRVINLSLGRPVYESYTLDPLCQAVETAWKAGIVVVVAAGNGGRDNTAQTDGYGTIAAPGNDPYAITVGAMKTEGTATRTDDLIASYSSKGPTLLDHIVKPDLVAPGNLVVSLLGGYTLAITYPGNIVLPVYFRLSGTSMATPVVSGAAALLLQAEPGLTPDQLKARMMKTAYKTFPASSTVTDAASGQTYVSYYDLFTVGAGYLDVAAALANKDLATGYALSPTAVYVPSNNSVTLTGTSSPSATQSLWGSQTLWNTQSLWSSQSIWGSSMILAGSQSLWGSQALWGSSTTTGFNSLWGSQSIWGSSTTPGTELLGITINGEK